MKETEFRGKLKNSINAQRPDGSWVYGGYYFWKHGACIHEKDAEIGLYVDRETVGQYTGYKDVNGVKIFEEDIVMFPKNKERKFYIIFCDGSFYAADLNCYGETDKTRVPMIAAYWWGDHGNGVPTIIGNVWDNPELLDPGSSLMEEERYEVQNR